MITNPACRSDVPAELLTDLDIENIYERWVERSPVGFPYSRSLARGHTNSSANTNCQRTIYGCSFPRMLGTICATSYTFQA